MGYGAVPVHVHDLFHLIVSDGDSHPDYLCLSIDESFVYQSFCDDFGPMSLGSVYRFCEMLEQACTERPTTPIAVQTVPSPRPVTNAAFLLGSYLIMKYDLDIDVVKVKLNPVMSMVEIL